MRQKKKKTSVTFISTLQKKTEYVRYVQRLNESGAKK